MGRLLPRWGVGWLLAGLNVGLWDLPRGLCGAVGMRRGEGAQPRGAGAHSDAVTSGLRR